jgi:hypothetical protein
MSACTRRTLYIDVYKESEKNDSHVSLFIIHTCMIVIDRIVMITFQ